MELAVDEGFRKSSATILPKSPHESIAQYMRLSYRPERFEDHMDQRPLFEIVEHTREERL